MRRLTELFLPFILPLSLLAQSTTGNLEGRIVDTTGAEVVGVNVMVISDALQGTRGCMSDELGHFRLPALPPGNYSVKLSHIGGVPVTLDNIRIFLGRTTNAGEIVLRERGIELEGVVVTSTRPLIDSRSTVTGVNLTDTGFRNLPIDRSYLTMTQLAPQSSPSFYDDGTNIAGATGIENRYFIDGADATDVYRGISGTQLPYNFVREVEVRSGAYEAEFPSALGGIVNAITYSGGNETRGQVFGFFTNNRFSGSPRNSVGKPPIGSYSEYDIGVSLGGPIVKDKLWYYAAYNPKFESEDVAVPGQPNQNDHSATHMFASKLSWAADESNLLTLSFAGDPKVRRGVGVDSRWGGQMELYTVLDLNSYLSNIRTGSINLALTGIHTLGPNTLLESSLSYVGRNSAYDPVGHSEPWFGWDLVATTQFGTNLRSLDRTALLHAGLRATLTQGGHTLKTGLEYSEQSHHSEDVWKFFVKWEEGYYEYQYINWAGETSSRNPSLFFQDSWRISERLTLNAGIRWDPQWLIASDGSIGQGIIGNVAPRLGIIYQPSRSGSNRFLASAGRFYQPMSLYLSTQMFLKSGYTGGVTYDHDPRIDSTGASPAYDVQGHTTNVNNLKGQYFDEVTLGYENMIGSGLKAGARLVYRNLGQAVNVGIDSSGVFVYGNPGSGLMEKYPRSTRTYKALELTLERIDPTGLSFQASYILSRNYGNYEGLFDATYSFMHGTQELMPNACSYYYDPSMSDNSLGLLPDDRTHQLKFYCSYPVTPRFMVGLSGYWISGSPLTELGSGPAPIYWPIFLSPRGSVGRSPSIWDANIRLVYDLGGSLGSAYFPRVILDVLHLFSQKRPVSYDMRHYKSVDSNGNQDLPNPNYGPIGFQPPMSMRLGVEVNF